MPTLTMPIIVNAKGDVQLFDSVHEAELAMEPVDVENSEFTIYDAQGLLVPSHVDPDKMRVRLDPDSALEERQDELVAVLRRFLQRVQRQDKSLVNASEDEILQTELGRLIALLRLAGERGMHRGGSWRIWRKR